jgi:putative tricarboxylic transport membrane protein
MARDGAIGVGLLALCAILWGQLRAIPENPLVPLGAAFYPRILLGVTGLLSLALLVSNLRASRRIGPGAAGGGWAACRPAVVTFGLSVLYAALLPGLGYLAATTGFVAGLTWGLGPPTARRVPGLLLLGVVTAAATWLIFQNYLRVFLPRAAWF